MSRLRNIVLVAVVLILAIGVGLVAYHHYHKNSPSTASSPPTPVHQPVKTTPAPVSGGQHPLSSIPPASQQRAKTAGYYCPSWDAQPGQVSSSICYPIYDDTQR